MNLIEQATKRLDELRRSGVDVPWSGGIASSGGASSALLAGANPLPRPAPAVLEMPLAPVPRPQSFTPDTSGRRSAAVQIDLDGLARAGYLVPSLVRSDLAKEFRTLKRPLLKNALRDGAAAGRRGALIMITSAVPGEGKTFTAVNLAMSLAMEVDTSVLLVDADVVRPSVLPRLGLQGGRGLLDVLTDPSVPLSDVMLRTNVDKLSLLPAGTPNPKSTELLASAAMERLLLELATKYSDRIVIFDAPPLLATTEARVLATYMGQVVMVVEASRTSRALVTQAFAAVEQCPNVMSVLNKSSTPSELNRYGYDY